MCAERGTFAVIFFYTIWRLAHAFTSISNGPHVCSALTCFFFTTHRRVKVKRRNPLHVGSCVALQSIQIKQQGPYKYEYFDYTSAK